MIADLNPYHAMKDSGVPWLGEVPEHCEVLPHAADAWFDPASVKIGYEISFDCNFLQQGQLSGEDNNHESMVLIATRAEMEELEADVRRVPGWSFAWWPNEPMTVAEFRETVRYVLGEPEEDDDREITVVEERPDLFRATDDESRTMFGRTSEEAAQELRELWARERS